MTKLHRTFGISAILSVLTAAAAGMAAPAMAQEYVYRTDSVAVTGGFESGTEWLTFGSVQFTDLNDSGLVAFNGVSSDPFSYGEGIWVGSPDNISLVVLSGDPVPGVAAMSFYQFWGGGLVNGSGAIAFQATYSAGGAPLGDGLWSGSASALGLLALSGDPAPGTPGYTFSGNNYWVASIDDLGVTTFNAAFDTSAGYGTGAWTGTPGSLEAIALSGDPAPDTAGLFFTNVLVPSVNAAGTAIVAATTDDPTTSFPGGYWKTGAAGLSAIAQAGDVAPGAGGRTFGNLTMGASSAAGSEPGPLSASTITGPVLNKNGNVAFNGYLNPVDPNTGIGDEGIWIQDDSGLHLAALVGDTAPGTAGLQFADFNHINYNALGQIAFDAFVNSADPASDRGIWRGLPGSLSLLVREGDLAPGAAGETFGSLVLGPSMNEKGEIVFYAQLAESGTFGVWGAAADGIVTLILREGETVKIGYGDYRTVQAITYLEGQPSSMPSTNHFNEAGQLVTIVQFMDGTSGSLLVSPLPNIDNLPPVANAGPDQTVDPTQPVAFNGTGSSDPEGGTLEYVWTLDSPDGPLLAAGPTPATEMFPPGTFAIFLTVTDPYGASAADSMVLTVTNDPPIAIAGPDQTIQTLETAMLDGSGSTDPNGDAIQYIWSIGGVQIATGPTPAAGPFDAGVHTVTLTVSDEWGAEATDQMVLTVLNRAPAANAGLDQTVNHAQTATLDATGSADPESGALTYAWTLNGVQIATGVNPAVGPFEVGVHTFTLTVTDDKGATATDSMVVTVVNEAPVANAGPDQTVNHAQTVTLNGSGSSDPEGGVLTYAWSVGGVQIATGASAAVGPFDVGVHTVTLTVTDDHGTTATDSMVVTVANEAPTANAGADQTVNHIQTVTLDATASSDPEGGPLTYAWSIGGVQVATGASATVGPFDVGAHTVTLTVTDDHGTTATDSMVVTVVNEAPVANAGPDQTVTFRGRNASVTLDGSASADPEGGVLSYLWILDGQTVGTSATVQLNLTAGVYTFYLSVTDDHGAAHVDSVVVTTTK
jgi:PKD repeat protein